MSNPLHYIDPMTGIGGKRPLWQLPLEAPVRRAFGADVEPSESWAPAHEMLRGHYPALDLAATRGAVVSAPCAGVITWSGDRMDGRGIGVEIWGMGELLVVHGLYHLGELAPGIRTGVQVQAGAALGRVGRSGWTYGISGRQWLQGPLLTWSTRFEPKDPKEASRLLDRFHALPLKAQAAGRWALRAWLVGGPSGDLERWIITVEQKGASAYDNDDGVVTTTLRPIERGLEKAGRVVERVENIGDKALTHVEDTVDSGTGIMLALGAVSLLMISGGAVWILAAKKR